MWPTEGYWNHGEVRARLLAGSCGGCEPSPSADVAGLSPVPVQMWRGEPNRGADAAGGEPSLSADAITFQPGAAQGSAWVRPCSPPSERCRGGKITDSPPFIRAVGANGCADQYAGAPERRSLALTLGRTARVCACVCAGPYCSACAEGYFEKGKLCAPCDPGTKDVMCAERSRAAPPRYIGRRAFGILLSAPPQVGHPT
jgi:hypothetical protein